MTTIEERMPELDENDPIVEPKHQSWGTRVLLLQFMYCHHPTLDVMPNQSWKAYVLEVAGCSQRRRASANQVSRRRHV
jgi:hypothetical protein